MGDSPQTLLIQHGSYRCPSRFPIPRSLPYAFPGSDSFPIRFQFPLPDESAGLLGPRVVSFNPPFPGRASIQGSHLNLSYTSAQRHVRYFLLNNSSAKAIYSLLLPYRAARMVKTCVLRRPPEPVCVSLYLCSLWLAAHGPRARCGDACPQRAHS